MAATPAEPPPLKPLVFQILLALVDGPRHGWRLVADVQQRLPGERLLPGNFYRTLRRLLAEGLIEEAAAPKDATDERRRYLVLSRLGERRARAEARRLETLLLDSRTRRLLGSRRP